MEDLEELEVYSNDATVHKNVVVLDSFEKLAGERNSIDEENTDC